MQTVVGAFVMPNAPIDPNTPLTAFAVPLEVGTNLCDPMQLWKSCLHKPWILCFPLLIASKGEAVRLATRQFITQGA